MGMGSGFKGRTNVSYWWHTWTIICMLHTRPCVLNDIANIKSRHVQSWASWALARVGGLSWVWTSPVQGQMGKCQHYRHNPPSRACSTRTASYASPLQNFQRAADIWRVQRTQLSWLNPVSHWSSLEIVHKLWEWGFERLLTKKTKHLTLDIKWNWNCKNKHIFSFFSYFFMNISTPKCFLPKVGFNTVSSPLSFLPTTQSRCPEQKTIKIIPAYYTLRWTCVRK